MEYVVCVLGTLFVAAVWDIGRRISGKVAVAAIELRVVALEKSAAETTELRDDIAGLDTRLRNLASGLEAQKAATSARRGAWPRVT